MFVLNALAEADTVELRAQLGSVAIPEALPAGPAFAVRTAPGGGLAGMLCICDGELRIELLPPHDAPECVDELLKLAIPGLVRRYGALGLRCDVTRAPERIPLLEKYGFERAEDGWYARPRVDRFDARRGMAYCGLACCVCGEGADCAGCRQLGCANYDECRAFNCCAPTGRAGCGQCDMFPCDWDMLGKLRVRTFARYAALHGEQALMDALRRDEARGVIYHYTDKLIGDYDLFDDETALMRFLVDA